MEDKSTDHDNPTQKWANVSDQLGSFITPPDPNQRTFKALTSPARSSRLRAAGEPHDNADRLG
jgi:hypothetical protein